MAVIEIAHLAKRYGKHVGARDVSFSVNEGEIFGFVGPNGAGKSTTIKVLMGFIFASGGEARILGLDVAKESKRIKGFTGYVPSDVRLYGNMRVKELLRRNSGFYPGGCMEELARLCGLFDIDGSKRFGELSTGNKKKVSLACALAMRPKVIILDEPTSGLDPMMQRLLFEELRRQTSGGATVLLSSHNLSEVQEYCDRVAFIRDGSILAVTDVRAAGEMRKRVTVVGGGDGAPEGLTLLRQDGHVRTFTTALRGDGLLGALRALGAEDFSVENERMEAQFWHLYGEERE